MALFYLKKIGGYNLQTMPKTQKTGKPSTGNTRRRKSNTALTPTNCAENAEQKSKKLRDTQKFREDLEKNPPSAFSPEYIRGLFTISKTGRRRRFQTLEELETLICEYFCEKVAPVYDEETGEIKYRWKERPLMGSLAIHLGMSRDCLFEYSKRGEFADTVKIAKDLCENYVEDALFDNRNPAGLCFTLKNGYGWRDSFEIEAVAKPDPLGEMASQEELEARIMGTVVDDLDDD